MRDFRVSTELGTCNVSRWGLPDAAGIAEDRKKQE
jgi:hypothetical protein